MISNLLQQVYQRPLEIIVVSDGSTDSKRSELAPYEQKIRFIELPRGGKPAALNAEVAAASGDIVVFADARQLFAPDAVVQLARISRTRTSVAPRASWFSIARSTSSRRSPQSATASACTGATRSGSGGTGAAFVPYSALGATGAIYALRRELWHPLPLDNAPRRCAGAHPGRCSMANASFSTSMRGRSIVRRPMHKQNPGARSARLRATTRSSGWNRGCSFRSAIPSGCSTCRRSWAGCSCHERWSRHSSRLPRCPSIAGCPRWH